MKLQAGSNFGPYRIVEPLGRGGMATVYKAYEPGLDRYVALKVLPTEFVHDQDFAERFRREARVVAKLEHPNIVPIYAFDIEQDVPWMAMRYVPGGTMAALMREGSLSLAAGLDILRGVAELLDYAHANGVIHRDVKPQNILLDTKQDHVYLADFGIARMLEGAPALTRAGLITGTPQYMAPEQAAGGELSYLVDIYSLGIVAYEMLTGHVPFAADTPVAILLKHVSDPIPLSAGDIPEPQVRALLKALAKKPQERYSSATLFVEALAENVPAAPADMKSATRTVMSTLGATSVSPSVTAASSLPLTTASPATPRPMAAPLTAAAPVATGRSTASLAWLIAGALALGFLILGGIAFIVLQLLWSRAGTPVAGKLPTAPPVAQSTAAPTPALATSGGATASASLGPRTTPSTAPTLPPLTVRQGSATSAAATTATPEPGIWPPSTSTAIVVVPPHSPRVSPAATAVPPAVLGAATGRGTDVPTAGAARPPTTPPSTLPFVINKLTPVGRTAGSTKVQNVRFRFQRGDLQANVQMEGGQDGDHDVEILIEVMDRSGHVLTTLSGRGTVEEDGVRRFKLETENVEELLSDAETFDVKVKQLN